LTVNPAILTYTADVASRLYGTTNPLFDGTVTGFVLEDTLGGATTGAAGFDSPSLASSNVGVYAINGSGLAANHGNYVFAQAASNATALSINPATLTYTANLVGQTYGTAIPSLSGTVTGFVLGDSLANATTGVAAFATDALRSSNVGRYAIDGSGLTANHGDYLFIQAAGNATAFTINPAILTITAGDETKFYGAPLPAFTATYSGMVNGDTSEVVSGLRFFTPATAASAPGNYLITPFGADASNYTIVFADGALSIVNQQFLTDIADATRLIESKMSMGGYNVIYEALALQLDQRNTAFDSSYGAFAGSDNPQSTFVHARLTGRKPSVPKPGSNPLTHG
jgi:hypothetical protein